MILFISKVSIFGLLSLVGGLILLAIVLARSSSVTRQQIFVEATNRARLAGYSSMDAYTPFPIKELNDALGLKKNPLPLIVLLGGNFFSLYFAVTGVHALHMIEAATRSAHRARAEHVAEGAPQVLARALEHGLMMDQPSLACLTLFSVCE